jgi:hypothetical protein
MANSPPPGTKTAGYSSSITTLPASFILLPAKSRLFVRSPFRRLRPFLLLQATPRSLAYLTSTPASKSQTLPDIQLGSCPWTFHSPESGSSAGIFSASPVTIEMTLTLCRAYDGKAKVWGMGTRGCVATHGETEQPLWCVKWLPKAGRTEMFVVSGAGKSIGFYREASGG